MYQLKRAYKKHAPNTEGCINDAFTMINERCFGRND